MHIPTHCHCYYMSDVIAGYYYKVSLRTVDVVKVRERCE